MGQRNRLLTDVGETAAGIDYAFGCFFGLGHRGTGFDLSCTDGGNVLDVLVLVVSIEGGGQELTWTGTRKRWVEHSRSAVIVLSSYGVNTLATVPSDPVVS